MAELLEPIDTGTRKAPAAADRLPLPAPVAATPAAIHAPPAALGEALPFRVRICDDEDDLLLVQQLRARAYGRHLPALGQQFGLPDPIDRWPSVTLFHVQDKATGECVGATRLQTNDRGPLQIEASIDLPAHLRGRRLAEVTRMTVLAGYPHPVKLALVKALHLYCIAMQIEGIVCASRPGLVSQYTAIGFDDLFDAGAMFPMQHGAGLQHRVLFRDTVTSEAFARETGHRHHAFVFRTFHPDIEVFAPTALQAQRLRQGDGSVGARAA